jgi:hypothetical protein
MTRSDGDLGLPTMYIIYPKAWNVLEGDGGGQTVGQNVVECTYVADGTHQKQSET